MKVGIISPTKFLDKYCTTDIQYVLPKLYLEDEKYRQFYQSRREKGDNTIVDCKGLGWKREPEEDWICLSTILDLSPQVVILPSYMYDYKKTLEIAKNYTSKLSYPRGKLVGCLEGTNFKEVGKCLTALRKISSTIAIPSHIYNTSLKRFTLRTI